MAASPTGMAIRDMNWLASLVCAGLGLLTTLALIPVIRRRSAVVPASNGGANFHHTHKTPVSRFGGVALAAAFVVVSLVIFM